MLRVEDIARVRNLGEGVVVPDYPAILVADDDREIEFEDKIKRDIAEYRRERLVVGRHSEAEEAVELSAEKFSEYQADRQDSADYQRVERREGRDQRVDDQKDDRYGGIQE